MKKMPTLHLKNESNSTILFGGKVGSILAGAERSIEVTTSEFEVFRPKLEKFKGKLRFWTDLEDHLQRDVANRISIVNEAAKHIQTMQHNLEKKTKAALSICLHTEENRLITCPKEQISIFCEDLITPKQSSWLAFIECNTHSPADAEGKIIVTAGLSTIYSVQLSENDSVLLSFTEELTQEQRIILDTIVGSYDPNYLIKLKEFRNIEIDAKTASIISDGFFFRGIIFSGSVESQNRIMGAYLAKDITTYPITWLSKDDTQCLYITDSAMITEFFITGFGALKHKIDIGSELKLSINNASSIEEVNAIVDLR